MFPFIFPDECINKFNHNIGNTKLFVDFFHGKTLINQIPSLNINPWTISYTFLTANARSYPTEYNLLEIEKNHVTLILPIFFKRDGEDSFKCTFYNLRYCCHHSKTCQLPEMPLQEIAFLLKLIDALLQSVMIRISIIMFCCTCMYVKNGKNITSKYIFKVFLPGPEIH